MTTVEYFTDLGVEMHYSDKVQWRHGNQVGVIAFAWRPINTLPDNPKFKYEINYNTNPLSYTNCKWRPLLDQSAVKSSDDKPVFTQAMADAGEFPPVGSEVSLLEDTGFYSAQHESVYTSEAGDVVSVVGHAIRTDNKLTCITLFNGKGFVTMNSDWCKPVRTPKQKAVDELGSHLKDIQCIKSSTQRNAVAVILVNLGYKKC